MSPDDERHGTPAGRKKHAKDGEEPCVRCKAAAARYQNQRVLDTMRGRPRTLSTTGVQRRIQALVALGYSYPILAEHLGVSGAQVFKWAKGGAYIRDTSRARIVDMYEALCMTHPASDTMLERRNAKYARTIAAKRGWLPPLAWEDIDDEDENPTDWAYRPPATRAEIFDDLYERTASLTELLRALDTTREGLEKWCDRNSRRPEFNRLSANERMESRQGRWAS